MDDKLTTFESDIKSQLCLAAQKVPPHSCSLHHMISRLLIWCHVSCVILAHPPSRYTVAF